jgi:radical SAM superfamily enzyme YgiQ (UPF0313 family)
MPTSYPHLLLVYPEFPKTYWGMQYSLPLFGKKALMPPLGLLTIAAMTPPDYEVRLVDLNCTPLTDDDLAWADMVCFSAMLPQKRSLFDTASRCQQLGKLVVFGGPFPTACAEECRPYCDVQVLNEGEVTWPLFLDDLAHGTYKRLYTSDEKPDVTTTPIPRFDLLQPEDYAIIPIQFSRGCPFQCEFCDIIVMFGRRPRTKTPQQFCAELQAVYDTGYRGVVFIVDDNFIGNKREAKRLLPALQAWNEAHGQPFMYGTEASINLADDPAFLRQLVDCQFRWVFVGLETPSIESLQETMKYQNTKRSLLESVQVIQNAGLLVYGGFIIGFDHDTEDIFDRQIEFITQAAISNAMVGLLVALPGTPLYKRLQEAGRLQPAASEGNSDQCGYTNIVTRLPARQLLEGYRKVIDTLYTPHAYFTRSLDAFCRLPHPDSRLARMRRVLSLQRTNAMFLLRRLRAQKRAPGRPGPLRKLTFLYRLFQGLSAEYKRESLKFLWSVLKQCPDQFPRVIPCIFMGIHYSRFSFEHVLPALDHSLADLPAEGQAPDTSSDGCVAPRTAADSRG